MGNVNNCLINNVRFDEINIKSDKNSDKDKQFNNSIIDKMNKRNILDNKYKFETVNEERIFQKEKYPNDNISKINYKENNRNSLKISPSNSININENQNIINFNNIRFNNGILLDNNILFNSTRKSNPIKKSFEKYSFNDNKSSVEKKNNATQDNFNFSDNNYGSNKVINTEEESDNLIVLDYNTQKDKLNNENKINVNDINGYNNNDGFLKIVKNINEINNEKKEEEKITNNFDYNNKNLILDNNNINKENYNAFLKNYNSNSPINEQENKNDINEQTQKSDKTVKNEFIETTNIFKKSIPYSKPKMNLLSTDNIPEDNKKIDINNKKQILNNYIKEEQNQIPKDNEAFFIAKNNEENNDLQSFNIRNQNDDFITSENKNMNNNTDEKPNFITNVRKINANFNEDEIQTKANNYILAEDGNDKNEIYKNINYKSPNIENHIDNKNYKQEINIRQKNIDLNEEYIEEPKELNPNNNEQNLIAEDNILYQTSAMNAPEINLINVNNDLYNSNSLFNSKDLNEGINSPIIKGKHKYFTSNDNSTAINRRYFNSDLEQNNIDNEDIKQLQKNLITQLEPRDKDSELDSTKKK